jgi:hypothetical protein
MNYFKNQEVKVGDYIFPEDDPKDRYKVAYVESRHSVFIEVKDDQTIMGWYADSSDMENTNGLLKKGGRYWKVISWNKVNASLVLKNE